MAPILPTVTSGRMAAKLPNASRPLLLTNLMPDLIAAVAES
jgi:hypothetical protein